MYPAPETNWLKHHGIKGQKWGVRRYQNEDGSLTEAGRKRYKDFDNAVGRVYKKMSNNYDPIDRQPIDIQKVQERSGLDYEDASECAMLAAKKYSESAKIEPEITNDVVKAAENANCKMYGLQYRLKQPTSMAGKIGSDAIEKGISFKDASSDIKDSIRYTAVFEVENFVDGYKSIKDQLEKSGYSEVSNKNYFKKYLDGESKHKAFQSVFEDPDGNKFEFQFQTPASQAAKELKIPLYEERRKAGISKERATQLEREMEELAERVEDPYGIYDL